MKHSTILNTLQNLTNHKPTQKEIADILEVSINTIGARATRDSNYSLEEIKKIGEHFGIDLFHQEKMNDLVENLAQDYASKKMQELSQGNCVKVVFRPDVYLSAGYGFEVMNENQEYMCLDERLFITDRGTRINPKNCEIVTVSGNSMAPEYRHGDRVILDKSVKNWIDGHIFAFRYNGECFIKEICLLAKRVKAIPINKEYEAFFIESDDEVEILGRIVPRVRL